MDSLTFCHSLLQGDNLLIGVNQEDYKVSIGKNGACEISSISTNVIICQPPDIQPEPDSSRSGEYPIVYVSEIKLRFLQIPLRLITCYTMVCGKAGVTLVRYFGDHYLLASERACIGFR